MQKDSQILLRQDRSPRLAGDSIAQAMQDHSIFTQAGHISLRKRQATMGHACPTCGKTYTMADKQESKHLASVCCHKQVILWYDGVTIYQREISRAIRPYAQIASGRWMHIVDNDYIYRAIHQYDQPVRLMDYRHNIKGSVYDADHTGIIVWTYYRP